MVRLDRGELTQSIQLLLSTNGKAAAFQDGLVVVSDKVQVIDRVSNMLDSVETAPLDTWVMQFYLISYERSLDEQLGVDVQPEVDLSFVLASASAAASSGTSMLGSLQAMLQASRSHRQVHLVAEPLFVLADGQTSTIRDAKEIPVPKRVVNEQGVTTTSGFDLIPVGLTVTSTVRDMGEMRALADVSIELSALLGFVESEAPIKQTQSYTTKLVMQSGGVYLIGELQQTRETQQVDNILQSVKTEKGENSVVQVWARLYKIAR
ncbi:hypothetical protein [Poriferisphaera sp. WC338]|uniref:hypothetical protein n=1 Tax=Poriferisphaera sp. WC338 TaxID=3425129 RepID=UPI003D819BE2